MNILDKVKAVFLTADVKLEAFDTADGKKIEAESLEVGKAVTIDGQPATEGEIVLADGRTLKIDATGNIAEIVDAPAGDVEAEMSDIKPDARFADLEATVMVLAEKINAMEGNKAKVEAEMSALKTTNTKLSKENEALNKKPAVKPTNLSKIEVKTEPRKTGDFSSVLSKAIKK